MGNIQTRGGVRDMEEMSFQLGPINVADQWHHGGG